MTIEPSLKVMPSRDASSKHQPHQPDHKRNERAKNDQRQSENQNDPESTTEICDVAADRGSGIPAQLASEDGNVTIDLCSAIQSQAASEAGRIAIYFSLIFDLDASAESGHISTYTSTNTHVTTETRDFGGFVVRPDSYVVPELGSVVRIAPEGGKAENREKQSTTDT